MFSNINNRIIIFIYLLIIFLTSSVHSKPFESIDSTFKKTTIAEYKRLASQCHIKDYTAWLEQQKELMMWLGLAKLLKLPIEDSQLIQQELEQFRLQHECLRLIERIPVAIGPG